MKRGVLRVSASTSTDVQVGSGPVARPTAPSWGQSDAPRRPSVVITQGKQTRQLRRLHYSSHASYALNCLRRGLLYHAHRRGTVLYSSLQDQSRNARRILRAPRATPQPRPP